MKNQAPIHICYIITRGDWGGAQRYVYDLARTYASHAQISIVIGGTGVDDLSQTVKKHIPNATLLHIPSLGRSIHPIKDIAALQALKQTLKRLSPDIVHLNSTKVGILGSLAATVVPTAKLVYTVHGWIMHEVDAGFKKWLYTTAERRTAPHKDAFIVLSKREYTTGVDLLNIPEPNIHIIPNGIDPTNSQSSEEIEAIKVVMQQKKQRGQTIFLTIANHYHTKGLDILIQAIKDIHEDAFHVYIAGDGPLRKALTLQIARYGLKERVTLLGEVANASKLSSTADYLVIPSRKEGLPYVLLEALQAHTPIIATDVGAIQEVVKDIPGCTIIPPKDSIALTKEITRAMHTKKSATPTLPIGYTLEAMTQATWSLYQSLL